MFHIHGSILLSKSPQNKMAGPFILRSIIFPRLSLPERELSCRGLWWPPRHIGTGDTPYHRQLPAQCSHHWVYRLPFVRGVDPEALGHGELYSTWWGIPQGDWQDHGAVHWGGESVTWCDVTWCVWHMIWPSRHMTFHMAVTWHASPVTCMWPNRSIVNPL